MPLYKKMELAGKINKDNELKAHKEKLKNIRNFFTPIK